MKKEVAVLAADDALANVGVREEGENKGRYIRVYLHSVGLSEGYSWCAAFVKYRFIQAANELNEDLSDEFMNLDGWTPNWEKYAKKNKIWISLEEARKNPSAIKKGHLVLFYSEGKRRIFHIGIVIRSSKDGVITVEGNTSPSTGVDADGDGVFLKRRRWSHIGAKGGFIKLY